MDKSGDLHPIWFPIPSELLGGLEEMFDLTDGFVGSDSSTSVFSISVSSQIDIFARKVFASSVRMRRLSSMVCF